MCTHLLLGIDSRLNDVLYAFFRGYIFLPVDLRSDCTVVYHQWLFLNLDHYEKLHFWKLNFCILLYILLFFPFHFLFIFLFLYNFFSVFAVNFFPISSIFFVSFTCFSLFFPFPFSSRSFLCLSLLILSFVFLQCRFEFFFLWPK